jgi:hypothetical protein
MRSGSSCSAPRSIVRSGRSVLRERVDASEQRDDARDQVLETDVLGEIVVGAEAQAGHGVEIAVACREKDDRQSRRQRA